MERKVSRRNVIKVGAVAGLSLLTAACTSNKATQSQTETPPVSSGGDYSSEEYVWVSALVNLDMFVAHDQKALGVVGKELGVKTTIVGPDTIDIPGMVATIDQIVARKPAGIMVMGFDANALIEPINKAVAAGIPTVALDGDVPNSNRAAFIGTGWDEVGFRMAKAMLAALNGKTGKVGFVGQVGRDNMELAITAFKAAIKGTGLEPLEEFDSQGTQTGASTVASAVIQSTPDLVGLAALDDGAGPGIGLAIREAGKAGKIIATCIDANPEQLALVKEGVMTAAIGQKRELFTYYGVKALFDLNHSPVTFTSNDKEAGVLPVPVNYNTGTYTVTAANIDYFYKA